MDLRISEETMSPALFPEDVDSFKNPIYKGACQSVSIVFFKGECSVLSFRDSTRQNVTLTFESIRRDETPLQCLSRGLSKKGDEYKKKILEALDYESTKFYCLVYSGTYRNYFVTVDTKEKEITLPPKMDMACSKRTIYEIASTTRGLFGDFMRKLPAYMYNKDYGLQDVDVAKGELALSLLNEQYKESKYILFRAGAIPYYFVDGEIRFFMGNNIASKISDFGGGVRKRDRSAYSCIMREAAEEAGKPNSQVIMSSIRSGKFYVCRGKYGSDTTISVLALVEVDHYRLTPIVKNREIQASITLTYDQFKNINPDMFHDPIQDYIRYLQQPNSLIDTIIKDKRESINNKNDTSDDN